MKKFLLLLLCCTLCLCILSGCVIRGLEDDDESSSELTSEESTSEERISDESTSEDSSAPADEHDHAHVNYKGLTSASSTLEDVANAEGREHDFTFPDGDGMDVYVYNNVTMDNFNFDQVQFSLKESYVRISCTNSSAEDVAALLAQWEQEMTETYGEASTSSDGTLMSWSDHTGNYVVLTQLNDKTIQLCFYLVA